MSEASFSTEIRDHVFLMAIQRPQKRNAFNLQLLRELAEAFTAYEDNDALWCAVLYAEGDHFTSGLDLAEVGPAMARGEEILPSECVDPLGLRGRIRSKPLVIAVQGWCLTIGVELCLAADIRVAADNTRFAQMEVQRGIMPFGGATLRFPAVSGWGNAMRYLLTGEEFSAQEALRIGLVQEVVPAGTQLERALQLASKVAACAPLAVQASLQSARLALRGGKEEVVADFHARTHALMASEDAMEGMMSFVQRREAQFKGK